MDILSFQDNILKELVWNSKFPVVISLSYDERKDEIPNLYVSI